MKLLGSKNYIDSLPNELLLETFKLVYASVHPTVAPGWEPCSEDNASNFDNFDSNSNSLAGSSNSEEESSVTSLDRVQSEDQSIASNSAHSHDGRANNNHISSASADSGEASKSDDDSDTSSLNMTIEDFARAVLEEVANEEEWDELDDPLSTSAFPYALAGVCNRWRSLMISVPEFWTRVVISIDSPDPLYTLARHVERLPHRHELETIVISHRAHGRELLGPEEGVETEAERQSVASKMELILQAIGPYLEDLKCLNATLPSPNGTTSILQAFITAYTGPLFSLGSLTLVNRFSSPVVPLKTLSPEAEKSLGFFWLRRLTLSGNVFVQLIRNEEWRSAMDGETLDSLTILSLRTEDGGTDLPFTVFDLFDGIYSLFQSIRYITLTDIDLEPSNRFPLWDPDEEYPDWRTERVHFKACPVGVIDSYSLYSPEAGQELTFEDCNLQGLEYCLPKTPYLTLKNLNAESLGIIIQKSDAIKMAFEDCLELTDKLILALANAHPDSCFLEQRHLRSLRLHACPRVSAKALKKIVSVRQKRRVVAGPMPALARTYLSDENDYLDAPPLKSLILSGLNGKRVSNGMRSWFEDNLEEFLEH